MDDSLYNPTFEVYYGRALLDVGRAQDAVPHLTHALDVLRQYRPGSIGGLIAREKLALAYANTGDLAAAGPLLEEAKAQRERTGDRNTNLNGGVEARVALLLAQGAPAEAERALGDLYLPPGDDEPGSLAAMHAALLRAEVALAGHQSTAAAQLAGKVRERVAASPQRSYLKMFEARAELIEGKATALGGELKGAEKLLRNAVELHAQIYDSASSPWLADAQVALAACLLELNRPDEARALEARARAIDAANVQLGPSHHQPLLDLQARLRKVTSHG
jgi:tetratricopeptide (TPR) repeat protein